MRVSTAFNKLLCLQGATVIGVTFGAEGVVVAARPRRRRPVCSGCARRAPIHDRSVRRWRHLDLGAQRCHLEAEICRVHCAECGVKVEEVPFARPGARHTRDFEDLAAFLAQQANKTVIAKLLRIDWATVGRIVERVVADHLDSERLAGLVMIGVDEVSWRKRHRYLTCVADHIDGGVVWAAECRSAATLQASSRSWVRRRRRSRLSRSTCRRVMRSGEGGDPPRADRLRPLPRGQARRRGGRQGAPRGVERPGPRPGAGAG